MSQAMLKIKSGPLAGQTLPVDLAVGREVTIGRGQTAAIRPAGYEELSREHAALTWDGRAIGIRDLNSRNGVLVDGRQVQTATLRSGSTIELGDFAAQVFVADEPQASQAEPKRSGQGYTTMIRTLTESQKRTQRSIRIGSGIGTCVLAVGLYAATHRPNPSVLNPDVAQRVKDATVFIWSTKPQGGGSIETSSGSGFVVGPRMVVTNRHVTCDLNMDQQGGLRSFQPHDCTLVFFSGSGHEKKMTIKADHIFAYAPKDPTNSDDVFHTDLSVLVLPEDAPVQPLAVGETESLRETQSVFVVGFPLGLQAEVGPVQYVQHGDEFDPSRWPQVSVMPHTVERVEKIGDDIDMLQLGGSATHGNSGGAVVNDRGEVVAVHDMGTAGQSGDVPIKREIPTTYLSAMLSKVKDAVAQGRTSA